MKWDLQPGDSCFGCAGHILYQIWVGLQEPVKHGSKPGVSIDDMQVSRIERLVWSDEWRWAGEPISDPGAEGILLGQCGLRHVDLFEESDWVFVGMWQSV